MFGLGGLEIVVIFVVALVVLGPEKLPQVANKLARILGELRRVVDQVRHEVEDAGIAATRPPSAVFKEIDEAANPPKKPDSQAEPPAASESQP